MVLEQQLEEIGMLRRGEESQLGERRDQLIEEVLGLEGKERECRDLTNQLLARRDHTAQEVMNCVSAN